jgi:hypothetical protein
MNISWWLTVTCVRHVCFSGEVHHHFLRITWNFFDNIPYQKEELQQNFSTTTLASTATASEGAACPQQMSSRWGTCWCRRSGSLYVVSWWGSSRGLHAPSSSFSANVCLNGRSGRLNGLKNWNRRSPSCLGPTRAIKRLPRLNGKKPLKTVENRRHRSDLHRSGREKRAVQAILA